MLNDYADAILSAIHEHEGDVLKLIGDGTLAIFTAADRASACHAAFTAALEARRAVAVVNERGMAASLPTTDMYLALHVGEVFYGNIGSEERLDFTVVGPAVNEVSRIASMCRSLDQPVLTSSAFASAIGEPKSLLVSVGRYALRGVDAPRACLQWIASRLSSLALHKIRKDGFGLSPRIFCTSDGLFCRRG